MDRADSLLKPRRKSVAAASVSRPPLLDSARYTPTFAHAFAHATIPLVFAFFHVDTASRTFFYNDITLTFTYSFLFHQYAPSGCLPAVLNVTSSPPLLQRIESPLALSDFFQGLHIALSLFSQIANVLFSVSWQTAKQPI